MQNTLSCGKISVVNFSHRRAVYADEKKKKRERKEKDKGIVDFMMVTNHFFHDLREWIEEMDDPRNPSYITCPQTELTYMAILKNVCSQYSMREMEENFNNENSIHTLSLMSGNTELEEMPHYDTLNYYLERLSLECLSDLRKKMVTSLISPSCMIICTRGYMIIMCCRQTKHRYGSQKRTEPKAPSITCGCTVQEPHILVSRSFCTSISRPEMPVIPESS